MFVYILGTMDHINYVFTVDLLKINLNRHYLTMNFYSGSVNKLDNRILFNFNYKKCGGHIYIYLLNDNFNQ